MENNNQIKKGSNHYLELKECGLTDDDIRLIDSIHNGEEKTD